MMCPPCKEAADEAAGLGAPIVHDPAICRDAAIQPHGCPCGHGMSLRHDVGGLLVLDLATVGRLNGTVKRPGQGAAR